MSNTGNVIRGHKANINNPNTSEEAKEHSKDVLEKEFGVGGSKSGKEDGADKKDSTDEKDSAGKNPQNVARGLKATLKNPHVSDEAKESAEERLHEMGEEA